MANGVCLAHRASALLGRLSLPTPVRWTFLGHPSGRIGFRSRARSPSELFRGSGRPSWRQRRLPRPTSQLTEPDGKRRPGQNRRSPHVVFFHKSLRLSRAAPCVRARLEVFCVRGIGRIARVSLAQGGALQPGRRDLFVKNMMHSAQNIFRLEREHQKECACTRP